MSDSSTSKSQLPIKTFSGRKGAFSTYVDEVLAYLEYKDAQFCEKRLEKGQLSYFSSSEFLEGEVTKPQGEPTDAEYVQWKLAMSLARSTLILTLSEAVKKILPKKPMELSPREIWVSLEKRYSESTTNELIDKWVGITTIDSSKHSVETLVDTLQTMSADINRKYATIMGVNDTNKHLLLTESHLALFLMCSVDQKSLGALNLGAKGFKLARLRDKLSQMLGNSKLSVGRKSNKTGADAPQLNAVRKEVKHAVAKEFAKRKSGEDLQRKSGKSEDKSLRRCYYCDQRGHEVKDCELRKEHRSKGIFLKNSKDAKVQQDSKSINMLSKKNGVPKKSAMKRARERSTSPECDKILSGADDSGTQVNRVGKRAKLSDLRALEDMIPSDFSVEDSEEDEKVSIIKLYNNFDDTNKLFVVDSGAGLHVVPNGKLLRNRNPADQQMTFSEGTTGTASSKGELNINVNSSTGFCSLFVGNVYEAKDCHTHILSEYELQRQGYRIRNIFRGLAKLISKNGCHIIAKAVNGIYCVEVIESIPKVNVVTSKWTIATAKNYLLEWHIRLGHASWTTIKDLVKRRVLPDTPKLLRRMPDKKMDNLEFNCNPCELTKSTKQSYRGTSGGRGTHFLHTLHSDTMSVELPGISNGENGFTKILVVVDDYTSYKWIYFLKSTTETLLCLKKLKKLLEKQFPEKFRYVNIIKRLRTDGGSEYDNGDMMQWAEDEGIQLEFCNPYNHEENGAPERYNRTLMASVRAVLKASDLKPYLWPEVAQYCHHIHLRLPNSRNNGISPYEMLKKKKPVLSLPPAGVIGYAHIPDDLRKSKKLKDTAYKCRFLGVAEKYKGYRVWDIENNCIRNGIRRFRIDRDDLQRLVDRTSSNPKYNDTLLDYPNPAYMKGADQPKYDMLGEEEVVLEEMPRQSQTNFLFDDSENQHETGNQSSREKGERDGNLKKKRLRLSDTVEIQNENRTVTLGKLPTVDKSTAASHTKKLLPPRKRVKSSRLRDYVCHVKAMNEKLQTKGLRADSIKIPTTLREALRSKEAPQWLAAAKLEMASIQGQGTWKLEPLPEGRKALGCKWVFAVKSTSDGLIERFKARLVVKGFNQIPGIDFDETFAPVARYESIKLLLALACMNDWHVHQIDISTAFLNGVLDDNLDIYMKQPPGFAQKGSENLVCKLLKSLYGMKQAGRVWYLLLHKFLVSLGFKRCFKEYCMYIGKVNGVWMTIVVYVDDITFGCKSLDSIKEIKRLFSERFKMTDGGEINHLLKMKIVRDRARRILSLSQKSYIQKILKKFGMEDCKPAPTPQVTGLKLYPETELSSDEVKQQGYQYRELIGALNHLVKGSRPDIANAVRTLSQFLDCYNKTHWLAALRVLRYLKGTIDLGLVFNGANMQILYEVFGDASFANLEDGRKSVTGFAVMMAGASISSKSVCQKNITVNTAEAELVASTEAVKEGLWVKQLISELGFLMKEPLVVWCDNQATIQLINNPANHPATKHIEIKFLKIREEQEKGNIIMRYVKTENQVADIFTKALPRIQFEKLRSKLGVKPVLPSEVYMQS